MAQSMSVPFRRQFSHLPWDLQLLLTLPYSLQVISLFFNFFFLLVYSCFTVLCWFLLCSKVHQPCVYTYPLFFGFLFCWGHHWALSRVPCSIQLSSVALSCLTLCDPMDCSTPGFPVLHQLPELAQTHVHQVGDAIQPSHPLSSSSPPTFNLSQHQGLFQRVSSSHQVARVLEFQLQH